ncbi:MAG TPA: class I SAM-dependent methyltransferase [Pseudonocardiaceae bacterium]
MTEPDFLRDTRASYNAIATAYAEHFKTEIHDKPMDRAMLAVFAELVQATGNTDVVDIGCGPGRVTARLNSLGLNAFGIDLSSEMVALARREHPGLRFEEGSMTALELPDGELGGISAWYSTIHIPRVQLPAVFAGFHRILAAGGYLVLAFQVGDGLVHYDEGFGHEVSLNFYRRTPDHIADLLGQAGFEMRARVVRERDAEEKTPQAYLLTRKPA